MLLEKYNDIAGSSDKKHAKLFSIGKTSKSSIPSKARVQVFVWLVSMTNSQYSDISKSFPSDSF